MALHTFDETCPQCGAKIEVGVEVYADVPAHAEAECECGTTVEFDVNWGYDIWLTGKRQSCRPSGLTMASTVTAAPVDLSATEPDRGAAAGAHHGLHAADAGSRSVSGWVR